ncbi:MAG: hypothetical protein PF495_08000 [Spirochaetales bacterium]|jgi:hypothetical protein|nr:hypothetical protein [Spirochaetales bacterium]
MKNYNELRDACKDHEPSPLVQYVQGIIGGVLIFLAIVLACMVAGS